jgi:two-component sensor histidine kinase
MGLPIVDMLTQQLGGTLSVRCRPGAAFTIEFLADTEPEKADAVSAA